MRVIEGDCLEVLKTLPDASIDAVVTDPPYPCSVYHQAVYLFQIFLETQFFYY